MKNALAVLLAVIAVALVGWRLKGGRVDGAGSPRLDHAWPPVKGQPYPDLQLQDARGQAVKLSSLRGKVLLVEPIGVGCAACNAYAGAERVGPFRGAPVQQGVGSFDQLLRQYARLRLDEEPDLVLVQLLLFDSTSSLGNAPTPGDARAWAEHFELLDRPNVLVLCGTKALANQASYDLVPGFQLVDRQGVLRLDGSGHAPKDHPYDAVLAAVPDLLREGR